jgi:hypothetical protein
MPRLVEPRGPCGWKLEFGNSSFLVLALVAYSAGRRGVDPVVQARGACPPCSGVLVTSRPLLSRATRLFLREFPPRCAHSPHGSSP